MPIKLLLTEAQARGLSLAGSDHRLSELVDDYGDSWATVASTGGANSEGVLLAPAPVHCELPRRGHDPAVAIWGYARCALVAFGRRVAVVSTGLAVESNGSAMQRPSVEEAASRAGIAWPSKQLNNLSSVADGFCLNAQPGRDAQSGSLNLRLLTATCAREQFKMLESAMGSISASRWSRQLPQTPAAWGRIVFLNDPMEAPGTIPDEAFQEISLQVGGNETTVCAHAAFQRMLGSDAVYVVIVVRGGPFEDPLAAQIDAMLRHSLEQALAHNWLATRAEQINDRQAECLTELLDEDRHTTRARDLRRQLGLLRYTFIDELELAWSYELDRQPGTAALALFIDSSMSLTHRWKRELTRFQRLASAADAASSAGFAQERGSIEIPEIIPGFTNTTNVLEQIGMWWGHRGHLRRTSSEGAQRGMSTLQRPGSRRGGVVPLGAREIELHPFRNRPALFAELSASIALTSFMTAASAVFLGVVLQKGQYSTLPMDVLFLFIATFGFLFATLIYANASGRLARHGTFGYESQVEIANRVSEYLGVFPLLVAIPLSVSRFLKGGPIPWAVAGLALTATIAYHYVHGASLLERDISDDRIASDWQRKYIFVPATVVLMTATFLGQLLSSETLEVTGAVGFGLLILLMVLLSAMLPERTNPQEYLVDDWDELSEETPSFLTDPNVGTPSG